MSKKGKKSSTAQRKGTQRSKTGRGGAARVYHRAPGRRATPMAVRVVSAVVAVVALAGGAALVLTNEGDFGVGVIVAAVALGVLAGIGLFGAIRTKEVVQAINKMNRR